MKQQDVYWFTRENILWWFDIFTEFNEKISMDLQRTVQTHGYHDKGDYLALLQNTHKK